MAIVGTMCSPCGVRAFRPSSPPDGVLQRLDRFEGDPRPTETRFIDMIDTRRRSTKTVKPEASEEDLKKFACPARQAPPEDATPPHPLPAVYPPLEAIR